MEASIAVRDIAGHTNLRQRTGKWFFVAMSVVLLAVVGLGFSRTLYFRAFVDVPSVPTYLVVHGIVLSIWLLWLLLQSSLVAAHRTDLHRRMGVIGVGIAACVVAVSLITALGFLPRMREIGVDFEAGASQLASSSIASLLDVFKFAALVALAFVYRRRPETHKRLTLFATIGFAGPASARMVPSLVALGVSPSTAPMVLLLFVLLLLVGPIAYDLITRGRPHRVTIVCTILQIGMLTLPPVLALNATVRGFVLGLT